MDNISIFLFPVLGETATLFIPDGFTLLANGEWYANFFLIMFLALCICSLGLDYT